MDGQSNATVILLPYVCVLLLFFQFNISVLHAAYNNQMNLLKYCTLGFYLFISYSTALYSLHTTLQIEDDLTITYNECLLNLN